MLKFVLRDGFDACEEDVRENGHADAEFASGFVEEISENGKRTRTTKPGASATTGRRKRAALEAVRVGCRVSHLFAQHGRAYFQFRLSFLLEAAQSRK